MRQIKTSGNRVMVTPGQPVQREPTATADDRLAALEAWQQDIERRIAALEKRKNPA